MVLATRPLGVALHSRVIPRREVLDHVPDLGALVEEVERVPGGVVRDPLPIGARGSGDHRVARGRRPAALAADDVEACAEALDVPLPRARGRLVEVVDVKDEVPLRAREEPEVVHVRVAAGLHANAGGRGRREIRRHHGRRASKERERRFGHPCMADRPELGNTRRRLPLQDIERIRAACRRAPVAVRRSRQKLPKRPARRAALPRQSLVYPLDHRPARLLHPARPHKPLLPRHEA